MIVVFTLVWFVIIGFVAFFIIDAFANRGLDAIGWLISLPVTVGLLFGGAAGTAWLFETGEEVREVVSTTEIVALQDGSSVSGAFFLGSGTIEGEPAYTYAVRKDGGYQLDMISADNIVLRYIEDGSKPRIEHVSLYFDDWFRSMTFLPTTKRYIYVPEGTVKQQYNVDLQ